MSEEPGEELAEKVAVFLEAWVHQVRPAGGTKGSGLKDLYM